METMPADTSGPEALIDLDHYSAAADHAFADTSAAYDHYRAEGESANITPSPFFYPDWYRWQNLNWTAYPTALAHFAAEATSRAIDPAPFIDSVLHLRRNPDYANTFEAIRALVSGHDKSVSPRLEDHLDALTAAQHRVHDVIRSELLGTPSGQRRRLVWVQSGRAFRPANWFRPEASRSWDLMCNWYALGSIDIRFGEMHLRQSGTKATGIHHALTHYRDLLAHYDQILFIDDDLGFVHQEIDRVFDIAEAHDLDMFQPAVALGSQCVWNDLFQRPDSEIHETTAVEIMMPGFSQNALDLCAPLFGRSVSGFGLDFECSEMIRSEGGKCGVVDAVAAEHIEVIDEKSGAYYEFMRALGINQKLELFQTIRKLGKLPSFAAISDPKDGGAKLTESGSP